MATSIPYPPAIRQCQRFPCLKKQLDVEFRWLLITVALSKRPLQKSPKWFLVKISIEIGKTTGPIPVADCFSTIGFYGAWSFSDFNGNFHEFKERLYCQNMFES